jgi:hypothetical protein
MTVCLTIDDDRMFSNDTPHTATRHGDKWVVSWLPDRRLGRNEAITAMTLAWEIAFHPAPHGRQWPFIVAWAGELGLSGQEAVAMCTAGEDERR